MEEIRRHRLYPVLLSLASGKEIEGYAFGIPPDELTIYGLLYAACNWRVYGVIDFIKTRSMVNELSKLVKDGINPNGYYAKYKVSFNQVWPAMVKDLARYDLYAERRGTEIRIGYKNLPEIYIDMPDRLTDRKYSSNAVNFDLTSLQRKIVSQHGTPYPEEVIMLRELAKLPQPIAEAISDCVRGVMERRFVPYSSPAFAWRSYGATDREIELTAWPERIHVYDEYKRMPDRRNWEAVAARLVEDKRRAQAKAAARRAEESSEEDLGCPGFIPDNDGW